jgi:hypothetical protein
MTRSSYGFRWIGLDGTYYHVISPEDVRVGQPRWWIDKANLSFYLEPRGSVGPRNPTDLHDLGLENAGSDSIVMALVVEVR